MLSKQVMKSVLSNLKALLPRHHFRFNSVSVASAPAAPPPSSDDGEQPTPKQTADELREVVITALTRRELPSTMVTVFKALLKSPKGLSSAALAKALGIATAQFSGVMGAFAI